MGIWSIAYRSPVVARLLCRSAALPPVRLPSTPRIPTAHTAGPVLLNSPCAGHTCSNLSVMERRMSPHRPAGGGGRYASPVAGYSPRLPGVGAGWHRSFLPGVRFSVIVCPPSFCSLSVYRNTPAFQVLPSHHIVPKYLYWQRLRENQSSCSEHANIGIRRIIRYTKCRFTMTLYSKR